MFLTEALFGLTTRTGIRYPARICSVRRLLYFCAFFVDTFAIEDGSEHNVEVLSSDSTHVQI